MSKPIQDPALGCRRLFFLRTHNVIGLKNFLSLKKKKRSGSCCCFLPDVADPTTSASKRPAPITGKLVPCDTHTDLCVAQRRGDSALHSPSSQLVWLFVLPTILNQCGTNHLAVSSGYSFQLFFFSNCKIEYVICLALSTSVERARQIPLPVKVAAPLLDRI